jgi:hypothetical protein
MVTTVTLIEIKTHPLSPEGAHTFECLEPEGKCSKLFRNVGSYVPVDTVRHIFSCMTFFVAVTT